MINFYGLFMYVVSDMNWPNFSVELPVNNQDLLLITTFIALLLLLNNFPQHKNNFFYKISS